MGSGRSGVGRRELPKGASGALVTLAGREILSLTLLRPVSADVDPFQEYPNRDWERLYRDVSPDSGVSDAGRAE
jgi:hypothetical protein